MNHPALTLGFSPCPNDTFMFDAMVHHRIDTEGLQFTVVLDDVESLNQKAIAGEPDITKLSYAAYTSAIDNYILLNAGSALGEGVGPLLVSNKELSTADFSDSHLSVAIPGKNTTANFLFSISFPHAVNKKEMLFSEIESAVLSERVDAGVIIHENRFTYQQKGLKKICDLGELWEQNTGQPIPLGGIAVKRSLPHELQEKIDRVMKRSVEYAFANPHMSHDYVLQHAQEMSADVRKKHIDLYVNQYSVDLGIKGRQAISTLFEKAKASGILFPFRKDIFVRQVNELMNN